MVRTQIQLEQWTYDEIRRIAFEEQVSMSAVVRRLIRDGLARRSGASGLDLSLLQGIGESGLGDVSENHDRYLGEDLDS